MKPKSKSSQILFEYLYRDAGNYKLYGSVVLNNHYLLSISQIEALIKISFIDGGWFDPVRCGIPPLAFEVYGQDLDHGWHEVTRISFTSEPASQTMDVTELMDKALKVHQPLKIRSCSRQEYSFGL
jgi:hypothetical protein